MLEQVLFKLALSSALLSTEVTLKLCDSRVDRFVLVEVALVRELLSTVGALVVVDLFVHRLLVLLQISRIFGHVATYVTNIGWFQRHLQAPVLHVHPVAVKLVVLEVASSDGFVTQFTRHILGGWGGPPLFVVVLQQPLVVLLCKLK